jgi:hypothetical protein
MRICSLALLAALGRIEPTDAEHFSDGGLPFKQHPAGVGDSAMLLLLTGATRSEGVIALAWSAISPDQLA